MEDPSAAVDMFVPNWMRPNALESGRTPELPANRCWARWL
jgi:hypothetical protein